MEQFGVKISGLDRRIEEEQRIVSQLKSIESDICSVSNGLDFEISSKQNIKNVLKQLSESVNNQEKNMEAMCSSLRAIRNKYDFTEKMICTDISDGILDIHNIIENILNGGSGIVQSALFPAGGVDAFLGKIQKQEAEELQKEENETKVTWGKGKFNLGKIKPENESSSSYELTDGKWKKVNKEAESSGKEKTSAQKRKSIMESIQIWSVSKDSSKSKFETSGEGSDEWGEYEYSAEALTSGSNASAYVGLGGIGGKIGIAVSAFSAKAAGQLGSDMFGIHGGVSAAAGKGELKAGADLKWMDSDGKFNPNVGVTGSAEFLAGEVSGKVGADVLGTKIDAKGSVNVGFGAHADIGFRDGKLKFDVGASAGLGASVDLEIDVSGTVDKVVDCVESVGETAKEAYNAVSEKVSEVADAVGDAYNDAKDAVNDFASGVAENVGEGFKRAWSLFR